MQVEPSRGKETSSYADLDESVLHPIVSLVEASGVYHYNYACILLHSIFIIFFVSYDYVHFEEYMIARIQCCICCSSMHMTCR